MQGVENPCQEASALPLVAAVGLELVETSASEPEGELSLVASELVPT